MMNENRQCPGVPELCEHSQAVISRALEGIPTSFGVQTARDELGTCLPCVAEIDYQVRFKVAMAQQSTEHAPPSLQLRISEALGRVDLGGIDVTDL
jgi:hypothetical protein